jgi:hypothetical protein
VHGVLDHGLDHLLSWELTWSLVVGVLSTEHLFWNVFVLDLRLWLSGGVGGTVRAHSFVRVAADGRQLPAADWKEVQRSSRGGLQTEVVTT